ncbi:MAG TPA: hypothetical protein VHC95_13655 [Opitutales bacterium]|nr:hypothetical protein [Opitutales bacterium]
MAWKDAKLYAKEWLSAKNLPADLTGQTFDLVEMGTSLECQGAFRVMVLRAAARELRHRGAKLKM